MHSCTIVVHALGQSYKCREDFPSAAEVTQERDAVWLKSFFFIKISFPVIFSVMNLVDIGI